MPPQKANLSRAELGDREADRPRSLPWSRMAAAPRPIGCDRDHELAVSMQVLNCNHHPKILKCSACPQVLRRLSIDAPAVPTTTLVFDIDNTLYDETSGLAQNAWSVVYGYMVDVLNFPTIGFAKTVR